MNELSKESSPYLLQHAANPVDWRAWNANSLAEARENNKLIIISIGYSACHWCHVMEHESFEDEEVAGTMNAHYINIKIDREEHPNVDAVYMKAVQLMTGHGGWPMNVVALPDGRPVWGGTYFRKNEWINALENLQEMYRTDAEKMIEYAEKLHQGINAMNIIPDVEKGKALEQKLLEPLVSKWKKSFDLEYGGMARAPKFMMPNNYQFLLRYGYQNKDQGLLDFVDLTLTRMAWGGLFDTVDGGFSRYSVDLKWHVPHFEKMLYDNGQLVSLYASAYKLNKNPLYKKVIEKTLSFVSRELTTDNGGFYCALDADSLNKDGKLEEGAFYVWEKEELQQLLEGDYELFSQVFNVNEFGHWEHGHFVLIQSESLEGIAAANKMAVSELEQKKKAWERTLYNEREKRSKPRLDDKALCSWNAIMLKGYVDAYTALKEKRYLEAAIKNAEFIMTNLWAEEGNLFHNYKDGRSTINGFLDDYCFVIEGFIALYEVSFDEMWLQNAKQLMDFCLEHFFDEQVHFFSFSSDLDDALVAGHFETEDNVIPASNSVMANNLFKLSIYYSNSHYEKVGNEMVERIIPSINYPSAFSNWMNVFMNYSENYKELGICGADALEYMERLSEQYLPDVIIAGAVHNSALPFLRDRFTESKMQFYICRNKTCGLPLEDFDQVVAEIKG